jgi:hypothetical protein
MNRKRKTDEDMARPFDPSEPARQPDYRRLQGLVTRRLEEMGDGIDALYKMFTTLRDRVHVLEGRMGSSHMDPYTFKLVDRKPVQCANDEAWWKWYLDIEANRRVAFTELGGNIAISTVFISLDLRPPPDQGKLFETMILGGKLDRQLWLARTWEGAERNHAEAVAQATAQTT